MLRIGVAPQAGERQDWPGLPPWLSGLLYARGVRTEKEAQAFLHPAMDQLLPPRALHDMDRAVSLLTAARDAGKRAAVYGDYDVDGVCASAILWEAFRLFGLPCRVYLPDRHREGYGLNLPAIQSLAEDCQVLVTVDCGITGIDEVKAAKALGMDVIVTDHHRHGEDLPPADAVITPLLGDYPFPGLCGAGVAWKLALALLGDRATPLMELAALATVADMVTLTGENRAIVSLGLKRLAETKRPGLRALMERAGVAGALSADQVAFQIAPRMNACGRMETAQTAFELLITRDRDRADTLALAMENLNQTRRTQEALVVAQAREQVGRMDLVDLKAIVVCGEGWNSGVVGLAAGRIAEQYAYPTVALAREGDLCVGSARSAGDIDIHLALSRCADLFLRFGGHKQAAGLTMKAEHLPEFIRRLSNAVAEQTGGLPPEPWVLCDGEMTLSQVTADTVRWLEMLEPYGVGNPAPRFLCDGASPLSLRAVGAEGRHLKCTFRQGDELRDGIFFGGGGLAGRTAGDCRLVMTPTVNEFRGRISAECRVYAMELIPESLKEDPLRAALSLLSSPLGAEDARPLSPDGLPPLMAGGQGTLLVCRALETALALRRRYPRADFCLEKADDPRAYHTILLYGRPKEACPSFRQVVLCDGDWGESGTFRAACPGAEIYSLPVTAAARRLLSGMYADQDALRRCYVALRSGSPRDLEEWAEICGLTLSQSAFALRVLCELELVEGDVSPFRAKLLPMKKRRPEESALFCRLRLAKEETDGLFGV